MAASANSSFLVSLLVALLLFASMQLLRAPLAASQPTTIVGGFIGSIIFIALLTAVSNFEMHTFGPNFQARIFPEVIACLFVALVSCGFVHRVCVTTCILFSLIALYYVNRISATIHGSTATPPTGYAMANTAGGKKNRK